jgi:transposase
MRTYQKCKNCGEKSVMVVDTRLIREYPLPHNTFFRNVRVRRLACKACGWKKKTAEISLDKFLKLAKGY